MYSILRISFFYDWPPFLPRTSMRVELMTFAKEDAWNFASSSTFDQKQKCFAFRPLLFVYTPFLLSSHTKLEFRHVISLSSSSVTTIKSQNLIHTHFLIPSIVFVISLVLKLSSWIETYLKTEGCQLKLAPLQIAKNPG